MVRKGKAPAGATVEPPAGEMRIEYMDLAELVARRNPKNPKEHDMDALGESIDEFGYVMPVALDEGTETVFAGHGRVEKLDRMKATGAAAPKRILVTPDGRWFVPVIRGVKFESPRQAERYLLADNRVQELGGWDARALAQIVSTYTPEELVGTGFTEEDVVKFMPGATVAPDSFPTFSEDLPTDFQCPSCAYRWSGNPKPNAQAEDPDAVEAKPEPARARRRAARA